MKSQPRKQTVTIHTLSNIKWRKMKFGQLIEYNMRKVYLEQSYIKCVEKLVPKTFQKDQN